MILTILFQEKTELERRSFFCQESAERENGKFHESPIRKTR